MDEGRQFANAALAASVQCPYLIHFYGAFVDVESDRSNHTPTMPSCTLQSYPYHALLHPPIAPVYALQYPSHAL